MTGAHLDDETQSVDAADGVAAALHLGAAGLPLEPAASSAEHPVWCVHCHRVWDGSALAGEWPYLVCADASCNAGEPSTFMPYQQTRRLIARHWPSVPRLGERLALHAPPNAPAARPSW
jgi:hypothetical protein